MSLSARTRRALACGLVCCAVLFLSGSVLTFVRSTTDDDPNDPYYTPVQIFWPTSSIPVQMVLNVGSGWTGAAQGALNDWNNAGSNFRFTYRTVSGSQPLSCGRSDDGLNVVGWSATACGMPWNEWKAAAWVYKLPDGRIADVDILFNSNLTWDLHDGGMPFETIVDKVYDFRRVAIHEFGHALGLDHPDEHGQSRVAMMNSGTGRRDDTDRLQTDDINGVRAIYGVSTRPPTTRCTLTSLGTVSGNITGQSLLGGGTLGSDCVSPNSGKHARYYSFRLGRAAEVTIDMVSSNFDSWMALRRGANISGAQLTFDDDGGAGLNARITRRLEAGTYTIEATSVQLRDTGAFRLALTVAADRPPSRCTVENIITAVAGRTTVSRSGTLGSDCVSPNYSGELARYYSFQLISRADVTIDMTSSNIDSWLTLRRGANIRGTQVAANDNGGGGRNARITRRLQAGTYTIEASSAAPRDTGTFRMTLTIVPVDVQPPSTPGRTTPPTLDLTCHGYDEGATRAYNCIPVPSQQRHMRTFVPPVGSACDRGSIAEFPAGRIVFQIRCRDGSRARSAAWSYSGQGRESFVKPVDTPRVWLRTSFAGSSVHLSVWCRAPQENLVANELLGTSWGNDGTSGIYGMAGCNEVEVDTGGREDLQWWFTQELAATALTPPRLWERVTGASGALGAEALQDLATATELERGLWRQPDRWQMNARQGASTRGAVPTSDDDGGARLGLRIASGPDDGTDAFDGAVFRGATRTSPLTLDLTCHGYNEGAARGTRAYNCIPVPSQQRYMRTFVPPVGSACDRGSIAEFPAGRIVFQIRCRDGSRARSAAWSYSGQGRESFVKPVDTPRVWLRASFAGSSVNLSVWCRAPQENLVVNELLGTSWGNDGTNGNYGMAGCNEVEVDTGGEEDLQWWFTQELAATALTPPRSWEQVIDAGGALPTEARQDLATAAELERLWSPPGR